MSVELRKDRHEWWYDFMRNKERYRGECKDVNGNPVRSRRAALDAEAREKARVAAETKGQKATRAKGKTLGEVIDELRPGWQDKKDWPSKQVYLREILAHFGPLRAIASVSDADIEDYITFARKQPVMVWKGGPNRRRDDPDAKHFWHPSGRTRAEGTVNRYLPTLRAIFERAFKSKDTLTGERVINELPEIKSFPVPERDGNPVPPAVLKFVIDKLPDHVRDALIASLLFGFRRREIYRLQIRHVDFDNNMIRLSPKEVKNKKGAKMPGDDEGRAMAFMRHLVEQARERGQTRLITWRPYRADPAAQEAVAWRPVNSPKRAWGTVMREAEKAFGERWRWHDVRAAFISLIANEHGLLIAQKLARHSDSRTTKAYIAVEGEGVRKAAGSAASKALSLVPSKKSPPKVPTKLPAISSKSA